MQLTPMEALDIFLRCSAAGQLILLCGIYLRRPITGQKFSLLGVAVCTGAYLLLTAPIPDADYGVLRNIFLIFTDALGFMIWLAALYFFDDNFSPRKWPFPVKATIGLLILWHLYFFGVLEGRGTFHDVNHAIAVALLVHVIYVALRGLNDDLIDRRRKSRILIAVLASTYGILIALAEFADSSLRNDWLFSLINALFIFLSIMVLARHLLLRDEREGDSSPAEPATQTGEVAPEFRALKQKLDAFTASGGYLQSGLSIKRLAEQLSCPEHQLRRLINVALGFRNFSAFLNSQRIRDAREQLQDQTRNSTPILTIALDLGYGSIGPFNRAFRAAVSQTPSEYRNQFQNRR